MRWVKFILLVQAVLTLVIGIIFLLQMFQVEKEKTSQLKINLSDENLKLAQLEDFGFKFNTAAYILFVVGAVELILIFGLTS